MKEKELYVDFKPQQLVYFVEKEDESYGPLVSGSQLSKNYLDDFFSKKRNLEISLRNQIMNNEISPVYYYMLLQELAPADLASRVGVSYKKLKRHFKPTKFAGLSIKMLSRYAEVFNIPIASMFTLMIVHDKDRESIHIEHQQGNNENFTITKISKK